MTTMFVDMIIFLTEVRGQDIEERLNSSSKEKGKSQKKKKSDDKKFSEDDSLLAVVLMYLGMFVSRALDFIQPILFTFKKKKWLHHVIVYQFEWVESRRVSFDPDIANRRHRPARPGGTQCNAGESGDAGRPMGQSALSPKYMKSSRRWPGHSYDIKTNHTIVPMRQIPNGSWKIQISCQVPNSEDAQLLEPK